VSAYKTDRDAFDGHVAEFDRWDGIYWPVLLIGFVLALGFGLTTHALWTGLFLVPAFAAFGMMTYHLIHTQLAYRRLYPKTPQAPLSQR
jgi:hypothetical protein